MDRIDERFSIARKELLDLSLKNPLINYKLRATTGLEFPSCNISDVFDYLVNDGKNVYFSLEETNSPNKLYVNRDEKDVHARIVRTYRSMNLFKEEKGANLLFLALGFLKWSDNDEVFYRSPLILVPVELCKIEAQDRYYIHYSGDEIRLNVSLITKLKTEFSVDIDFDFEEEIKAIDNYMRFVDDRISKSRYHSWSIETNSGAFDFFSYAKFLMYKDLDLDTWMDDNGELNNPVLKKLFVTNFDDKLSTDIDEESELLPLKICNVVDADSSQAKVIYDINKGKNMVIQGPPGTGKSQTITNIIASSIANGKSILFVSEKMAALEVVKNRLEKVGLGDLVLELHSSKANKVEVLKSIDHTLKLGEPKKIDDKQLNDHYEDIRIELNRYQKLMNKRIGNSKLRLIDIYGNALKIKETIEEENLKLPRISFDEIETWSNDDFNSRLELVKEYENLLETIGNVEKHPYYGVGLLDLLPYEQVSIKEKLSDLEDALSSLVTVINEIGTVFGNKTTNNIFDSKRLINSIDEVVHYKKLDCINCIDSYYVSNARELDLLIDEVKYLQKCKLNEMIIKDEMKDDAIIYLDSYKNYYGTRFFKRKEVSFLKDKLKEIANKYHYKNLKELNKDFLNYRIVKEHEELLSHLFKDLYNGLFDTNWDVIVNDYLPLIREFHTKVINYNIISQAKFVLGDEEKIARLLELEQTYFERKKTFEDKIEEFFDLSSYDYRKKFDYYYWYMDLPFADLRKIILGWKNNVDSIVQIVEYNSLRDKIIELGMKNLLEYSKDGNKNKNLDIILSYEYFDSLINLAYKENPSLSSFREYKFERIIDIFKDLDVKIQVENIRNILDKHYSSMPKINDNIKEMNIIRRELQKKRNQMPIRKLFLKSGSIIQKIKPVFMMSPISVASFLPPKQITFDLVVFDEASQVRPVEAFGALLRAKQIVVVGDSKQLPPTTFFDTMTSKYDEVNDEDYDITNMESILSLLLAKNIPQRTLSWHYRSKNRSLIMLSNNEFYNHSLKIFPSVNDLDPEQGLIFRHIPESVYDRGGRRTNSIEAKEVIKEAFAHAINYPHLSLGIASFSLAQQDELYKEFTEQMKTNSDPRIKAYFQGHKDEPFFIKNLESVQGDERDAIFISVGYGYDKNHTITMDFGPLNKDGGERRLNVLITRAKVKCVVFSNITSHDINLSKTNAQGVASLKRFLEYAQNRIIYKMKTSEIDKDQIVEYLNDRLQDYGYEIDNNIGREVGVDIAVYDKELKRFICGLECDGGAYKDLANTTDRERIRRNMLKSLGWKVHHVWSPDFYRNPKNEFEKILDFIADAKENETDSSIMINESIVIQRNNNEEVIKEVKVVPYKLYSGIKRRGIIFNDRDSLKKLIEKIVKVESPISISMLKKRLVSIIDLSKFNDEQNDMIMDIIHSDESIFIDDDFVFDKEQDKVPVRNRNLLDKSMKKLEYIAKEEFIAAIYLSIESGDVSTYEDVYKVVSEYLGMNKSTNLKNKLKDLIDELVMNNNLYIEDNCLYIND